MDAGGGIVVRYLPSDRRHRAACAVFDDSARLARSPLDRARPPGVMTQDRTVGDRAFRRFLFLIDPQRRSGHMSLLVNPVMVKEFRTRRFGRGHWTMRLIALSAILSLGLACIAAVGAWTGIPA